MKLAIFADDQRYEQLKNLCGSPGVSGRIEATAFYMTYDDFIRELPHSGCTSVIVAHKGATGMQAVRAAKILMHHIPIVWLSDDSAFVEESYNNGCAYFSAEAITEKLLSSALKRCENERIS